MQESEGGYLYLRFIWSLLFYMSYVAFLFEEENYLNHPPLPLPFLFSLPCSFHLNSDSNLPYLGSF